MMMMMMMMMNDDDDDDDEEHNSADHFDGVEHEIATALLLRGEFVTVVKCVTVIGVGHQLSLEEDGDIRKVIRIRIKDWEGSGR